MEGVRLTVPVFKLDCDAHTRSTYFIDLHMNGSNWPRLMSMWLLIRTYLPILTRVLKDMNRNKVRKSSLKPYKFRCVRVKFRQIKIFFFLF